MGAAKAGQGSAGDHRYQKMPHHLSSQMSSNRLPL
jgi:hypothetical protein